MPSLVKNSNNMCQSELGKRSEELSELLYTVVYSFLLLRRQLETTVERENYEDGITFLQFNLSKIKSVLSTTHIHKTIRFYHS